MVQALTAALPININSIAVSIKNGLFSLLAISVSLLNPPCLNTHHGLIIVTATKRERNTLCWLTDEKKWRFVILPPGSELDRKLKKSIVIFMLIGDCDCHFQVDRWR
jgi:hypothetical protein